MLYHPVKIGSIELNGNLFLAPVAGYSDRSFRKNERRKKDRRKKNKKVDVDKRVAERRQDKPAIEKRSGSDRRVADRRNS